MAQPPHDCHRYKMPKIYLTKLRTLKNCAVLFRVIPFSGTYTTSPGCSGRFCLITLPLSALAGSAVIVLVFPPTSRTIPTWLRSPSSACCPLTTPITSISFLGLTTCSGQEIGDALTFQEIIRARAVDLSQDDDPLVGRGHEEDVPRLQFDIGALALGDRVMEVEVDRFRLPPNDRRLGQVRAVGRSA